LGPWAPQCRWAVRLRFFGSFNLLFDRKRPDGTTRQTLPGRRGDRGPKGKRGEKGERGERGPGIVGWDIDRDNYAVSAILSDQTRSTPLDLRGLFEQYLLERINVDG
jgi:hypothetical protein